MGKLTVRHEAFCRLYLANGGNGAAAYRETARLFPNKPLVNMDGAPVIACRILKLPQVQKRVKELQQIMATKADITVDKILTDYQQALDMAKGKADPNAIVNAASAQAKLVGLLRDRTEVGAPGSFEGAESWDDILLALENDAGPEAADALRKVIEAKGHQDSPQAPKTAPAPSNEDFDSYTPPTKSVN